MLELGLTTIRITNTEIMQNIDGVCEYLQQHVQQFYGHI